MFPRMVNYEVEFTKELELVNLNQGRHHTQGASAASAAKVARIIMQDRMGACQTFSNAKKLDSCTVAHHLETTKCKNVNRTDSDEQSFLHKRHPDCIYYQSELDPRKVGRELQRLLHVDHAMIIRQESSSPARLCYPVTRRRWPGCLRLRP